MYKSLKPLVCIVGTCMNEEKKNMVGFFFLLPVISKKPVSTIKFMKAWIILFTKYCPCFFLDKPSLKEIKSTVSIVRPCFRQCNIPKSQNSLVVCYVPLGFFCGGFFCLFGFCWGFLIVKNSCWEELVRVSQLSEYCALRLRI